MVSSHWSIVLILSSDWSICYKVTMIVGTEVMRQSAAQLPLALSFNTTSGSVPVVTSAYPSHSIVTGWVLIGQLSQL